MRISILDFYMQPLAPREHTLKELQFWLSRDPLTRRFLERMEKIREEVLFEEDYRLAVDVGCGSGLTSVVLAKKGEVMCVDLRSDQLKEARRKGLERGCYGRMTFLLADARWLPIKDKSADVVVFWESLRQMKPRDLVGYLKEARRISDKVLIVDIEGDGLAPEQERFIALERECEGFEPIDKGELSEILDELFSSVSWSRIVVGEKLPRKIVELKTTLSQKRAPKGEIAYPPLFVVKCFA